MVISTVVKHSYIKGQDGGSYATAHVQYISNRPGPDREDDRGRMFFSDDRDGISKREVNETISKTASRPAVTIHKIILSPGIERVDIKQYTREVMREFSRQKGQDLHWRAVVHRNTNHAHAHVIVMSKDKAGRQVLITKKDYRTMRELGNDYLEREHKVERFLDRDIPNLLRFKEYNRTGDEIFNAAGLFLSGNPEERKKKEERGDPERERGDFWRFQEDMHRALNSRAAGEVYGRSWKRSNFELSGRRIDFHGRYTDAQAQERLYNRMDETPERAHEFEQEIKEIEDSALERRTYSKIDPDVINLLWGHERQEKIDFFFSNYEGFREAMDKYVTSADIKGLLTSETPLSGTEVDSNAQTDNGATNSQPGQSADDSNRTFQNDSEIFSQMDSHQKDERGRDDGDYLFERGGF